jgi:hypothetical protein
MAKFSKKVMGKEIGDAEVYAEPHTMKGKKMNVKSVTKDSIAKPGNGVDKINMSVAGISKGNYAPENKYGKIQMRGTGAATKGKMSSGKMG